MFKTIVKFVIVSLFCNITFLAQAQKQTNQLKSTTVSIDSSYAAICSGISFLPTNAQRGLSLELISQLKDKRMIFADISFNQLGISVYDGNNWSYIDSSNYLNSGSIFCFYTDRKKNTWIGTDLGINVYNGISWTKYSSKTTQYNTISSICEDKNGIVWAFNRDNINNNFILDTVNHALKQINTPIDNNITSSTMDKDQNMWVATRNGVFKYDGNKWTKYTTKEGLYQNYVTSIKNLNDTIYCLSGQSGDSIKKFNGNKFITVLPPSSAQIGFGFLAEDSMHNLWTKDMAGVVFRYSDGNWTQISLGIYGLFNVSSMFVDNDGNIWFTDQSSKIAKLSEGRINVVKNNLDKGIGFIYPVNPFVDKNNNVWVRPQWNTGVSKYDGKKWIYFDNDTMNIWMNRYVGTFAQDKDGNLYTGGAYCAKYDGKRWTNPYWNGKLSNYFNVNNLMFDNQNSLWFTCDNKVVKFDGNTTVEFGEAEGILPYPQKIIQAKDSSIWIIYGNSSKVFKYDGKNWAPFVLPIANTMYSPACYDAAADTLGNVWFATATGLVRYNKSSGMHVFNTFNSKIPFDYISNLCVDANNNVLFTTYTSTIGIYTQNTFKSFSLKNYGNIAPQGIAVDNQKNVYLGSYGSGLLKISFNLLAPEIIKTDINCVGADNGIITILPNNDQSYTYTMDGIAFRKDTIYNNLKSGYYNVICKKGQCYSNSKQITINQPSGKFDFVKKDATCYGLKNGSIIIQTEGLGHVNYLWPNGKDSCLIDSIGRGTYKVTVKYGTCQFDRSFDIHEPKSIKLTGSQLNACGNKGKIDITLADGVVPYTIKWSNGDSVLNLKNLLAGNYTVSIRDANKCNTKDSTFVIASFNPIPTSSIIGISKTYICSDSMHISTKNDYAKYNWYKDNLPLTVSTKSIYIKESATYKVSVVDNNKCLAVDSIIATKKRIYAIPQICLVTVDETTNKNKIIWNKFAADSTVIINVSKETNQSDKYTNIGKVFAYSSGLFTDVDSDPATKANRYKLNLTDECKIDSDTGTIHKTMHLTSNLGTHGEINLIWSGYEGFSFNSYNIYRGSSKSNLTLLTNIASNLNSYTDINPPGSENVYYQLEVISPFNCSPDALKAGIFSSRSNIINKLNTAVSSINSISDVNVFPNPAENTINITFDNLSGEKLKVKICDLTGKVLLQMTTTNTSSVVIERGDLKSGIYFLEIEGKTSTNRVKLILK